MRNTVGKAYVYKGHPLAPIRAVHYAWPHGHRYHRYTHGMHLLRAFWLTQYYIYNYADYGLDAPPPGEMWIRYGADLLLINVDSGYVDQTVYGVFDESAPPPPGYDQSADDQGSATPDDSAPSPDGAAPDAPPPQQ